VITRWTHREDTILRRLYPAGTREEFAAALPRRTWDAVTRRAFALGVKRARSWSPEEDAELRRMWPEHSRRTMTRNLDRTWDGIRTRARLLGLTRDEDGTLTRWKGFLTLRRAAKANGYCERSFRAIVRAYQRHFAALPQAARADMPSPDTVARGATGKWAHLMIDAQAARDAVDWWMTQETATQAAARLGVPLSTLTTWLHERGVRVPKHERRAPAWWDAFRASVGRVRVYPARRAIGEARAAA
jgi:hypothetical protein